MNDVIRNWAAAFDAMTPEERMDFAVADIKRKQDRAAALVAADPELDYLSAFVIAGDMLTLERSQSWVRAGADVHEAATFVGSFGRLAFYVWAFREGKIELDDLLDRWPSLWTGSDPDDRDPAVREIWHRAYERNGCEPVTDGDPLPPGDTFEIFRGHVREDRLGLAWSLDRRVAEKFARGAGTRQSNRNGTVYSIRVPRSAILAYLTGRGEAEVIVDLYAGSDFDELEAGRMMAD